MTFPEILWYYLVPTCSSMVMLAQIIKINQLRKQLKEKAPFGTLDYYLEKEVQENSKIEHIVLVVNKTKKCLLTVEYGLDIGALVNKIYCSYSYVKGYRQIFSCKQQLELDKQNLIEERKKLLLMEESLAKKEQAIIEMEVQQELDS
mgnify:FL=1